QTCAEDSGLEVEALGGRPGVHSARYPGATYADKFTNLYRELADWPKPWKARYVCSIAVVGPAGEGDPPLLFTAEGTVDGEITEQPRGSNGFGYDPIFLFPPFGKTLGEVSDEQKLTVSHRGKAFALLRHWLE